MKKTNYQLLLLLIAFSINIAQNVEVINSVVVGGVTSNTARFWVRTSTPAPIKIELSEDNSFNNSILTDEITTTTERGNSGIVEAKDLTSNTKYYYRVISGTNLIDNSLRSFWTFPEPGSKSIFSSAFGSCQQSGPGLASQTEEVSVFDEIINHDVRLFLQLGDWGYPDTTDLIPLNNNFFAADYELVQNSYWSKYDKDYPMDKLLRLMPVDYVYDDHDFMNNNSSATTSSFYIPFKPNPISNNFVVLEVNNPAGARENSIRGYKENLPGYPLENESRGIYHKFTVGNIEFFALDLRAQKSPSLNAFRFDQVENAWVFDPPEDHTIIGRENSLGEGESQLSWFLNSLKNSTADWKFIMSSVPFNIGQVEALYTGLDLQNVVIPIEGAPEGSSAIAASLELSDGWSGFQRDSDEILNFIKDNNIKNVIVLSGDSHNAAIDDGANAGLPEIMAGNLDITNSKSVTLFESFGIKIWNKGGHGISTDEFNDAFGKVTVFEDDSIKLSLIDEFGNTFAQHTITNENITSVKNKIVKNSFVLEQNYPNPFNPSTIIKYQIPEQSLPVGRQVRNDNSSVTLSGVEESFVTLRVYDILGREVATLVNQKQKPGNYEITWDGLSAAGRQVPSGVYFYKLQVGKFIESKKMVLLR
jgi:alkaline phosphatase D